MPHASTPASPAGVVRVVTSTALGSTASFPITPPPRPATPRAFQQTPALTRGAVLVPGQAADLGHHLHQRLHVLQDSALQLRKQGLRQPRAGPVPEVGWPTGPVTRGPKRRVTRRTNNPQGCETSACRFGNSSLEEAVAWQEAWPREGRARGRDAHQAGFWIPQFRTETRSPWAPTTCQGATALREATLGVLAGSIMGHGCGK